MPCQPIAYFGDSGECGVWLSTAVACDITTVSWQLRERGAEQGRTVNPRICLNVSSEKPPCLTPDTLMALTSTDLRLTYCSVSLCLCLLLCSYDTFGFFARVFTLNNASLGCCRCALTFGLTWCEQRLTQRCVTRCIICSAVAIGVRQSTFVWTTAGHVMSQFSQVLLPVEETFMPTLHHLNEVTLMGYVKWYPPTNGNNRVKWWMNTIPIHSVQYHMLQVATTFLW